MVELKLRSNIGPDTLGSNLRVAGGFTLNFFTNDYECRGRAFPFSSIDSSRSTEREFSRRSITLSPFESLWNAIWESCRDFSGSPRTRKVLTKDSSGNVRSPRLRDTCILSLCIFTDVHHIADTGETRQWYRFVGMYLCLSSRSMRSAWCWQTDRHGFGISSCFSYLR